MSSSKRSTHELKRLVEEAVRMESDHESRGLRFFVASVEVTGHPPQLLEVSATLHFLPGASSFCCGEPGCHLTFLSGDGLGAIEERVRRKMGLRQSVSISFGKGVGVFYHEGVVFRTGTV
jgi:hypothetical protein